MSFAYFAANSDPALQIVSFGAVGGGLLIAGLLFFFPQLVLRGLKTPDPQAEPDRIPSENMLQIGMVVIGLYFTVRGLQSLFNAVLFKSYMASQPPSAVLAIPEFGNGLFTLGFGVFLIVGARQMSSFILRLRRF
ncbi:hypothetical protein J7481_06465 [Labrenzia sp. R4_2]|uniref:hypothetical protein n=1 Tax=Labrenzia sp. R4_2 TaxID=2821107 RepID=UPI001ADB5EF2|nr:hypothetical protein [Labrenzia sp. R4_2]MBO9419132.1 hypothetical protein [Labrenzia sp. R4_2]